VDCDFGSIHAWNLLLWFDNFSFDDSVVGARSRHDGVTAVRLKLPLGAKAMRRPDDRDQLRDAHRPNPGGFKKSG